MEQSFLFYPVLAFSALTAGISKSGVPGVAMLGAVAVPLVMSAKLTAFDRRAYISINVLYLSLQHFHMIFYVQAYRSIGVFSEPFFHGHHRHQLLTAQKQFFNENKRGVSWHVGRQFPRAGEFHKYGGINFIRLCQPVHRSGKVSHLAWVDNLDRNSRLMQSDNQSGLINLPCPYFSSFGVGLNRD